MTKQYFPFPKYMVFTHTATDDLVFNLTTLDVYFKEADIFITSNDASVGSITDQPLTVYANDVYTIRGVFNIRDLYFKNATAGSNCVVAVAGVCLSDYELKQIGIT